MLETPDTLRSPEEGHAIAQRLLAWTQKQLPDFPWRHTNDPYALWVAVVMLQQTQVATALPYYRSLAEYLRREIREELGLEIEVGEQLTTVHHAYSHFRFLS